MSLRERKELAPRPESTQPPPPGSVRAITEADLSVVFQPLVDLRGGSLFAYEALVRCKVLEFASPAALFARAVAERACGSLGRKIRNVTFPRCKGQRAFVNVHPAELGSRWIIEEEDPVYSHDGALYLEVTESAAFEYYDLCLDVLKEVCQRSNARLVVDDFGAGYSNLMRVLELRPEVVKLDLTLVRQLAEDARKRILVRHLVSLCTDLGAEVVIEGIETMDELHAARDCGVHYGQGNFFAQPAFPLPTTYWPLTEEDVPSVLPLTRRSGASETDVQSTRVK